MKVIHLISGGDSGGAKTHVHSLLQGLSKHIQADMVCFTDGPFAEEARALGISVTVLSGSLPAVLRQLKLRIREGGYDMIHCHGARGNLMGALLKGSCRIPVVTTVHSDPELDYMGRTAARLTFGTLNNWALRRISHHICVSPPLMDTLIDRGVIKNGFFTICNGVSFADIPQNPDRLSYLRGLGAQVDEDSVVIGIAARLNPVKDISTLVRGFADAYQSCPRLRLIIAGDGEERPKLEALACELGVSDQITFAGWITGGMDQFYGAIDINALTSLSEGFPYVLPEGARYKLATVATRVGGIPYIIDHGINGFLFTPGDHKALGGYFSALGNDDELRRSLGQRLYEKSSVQFSAEATVRTQLDIYRRILSAEADRRAGHRTGVVLCGAYGRGNAGDEAILSAIVTELHSLDSNLPICVMSRNPRQTRRLCHTRSVFTFHYFGYRREMARAKLYINGGGSLIQDVTSRRSLWFYLSTLSTAHRLGCRVMMYGCGIGPLRHNYDRRISAKHINRCVDVITLRDRDSMEELRDLGVTIPHIQLAADPTVSLPPAPSENVTAMMEQAGLSPSSGEHYLGITVRPWPQFEAKASIIAASVRHVYQTYGLIPVFIPIEPGPDIAAARQVASFLKDIPHAILSDCSDAGQAIALFSRMDMVMSMRLHALIFSAVRGVPLVGLVYDPKVSSFLDFIEQDLYAPLETLDLNSLTALLDQAALRIQDRDLLKEKAARLSELERNNLLCAQELLNS